MEDFFQAFRSVLLLGTLICRRRGCCFLQSNFESHVDLALWSHCHVPVEGHSTFNIRFWALASLHYAPGQWQTLGHDRIFLIGFRPRRELATSLIQTRLLTVWNRQDLDHFIKFEVWPTTGLSLPPAILEGVVIYGFQALSRRIKWTVASRIVKAHCTAWATWLCHILGLVACHALMVSSAKSSRPYFIVPEIESSFSDDLISDMILILELSLFMVQILENFLHMYSLKFEFHGANAHRTWSNYFRLKNFKADKTYLAPSKLRSIWEVHWRLWASGNFVHVICDFNVRVSCICA